MKIESATERKLVWLMLITVGVRVRPTLASSRFLIFYPTPRSIHTAPGFLAEALKTRRGMAKVVPRARPLSEVDRDASQVLTSAEKKTRLEVEAGPPEEQVVASTSSRAATKKKSGGARPKGKVSKKKRYKYMLPGPYSPEDVLWRDVRNLLGGGVADGIIEEGNEWKSPFQPGGEVQVEVSAISSAGVPLHRHFSHVSVSSNTPSSPSR